MSNYLLCVGGTGSKVGEAFVYLAAAGYFGRGKTQIWIVDKDTLCGNGNALIRAVADYNDAKAACEWADAPCFNHEISVHQWNFDAAIAELDVNGANGKSPFGALGNSDDEVAMMMDFLHDINSLNATMSKGFYGRAQTGTALYKAIEETRAFRQNNELFEALAQDIREGGRPNIFLAGSSFGATGASMLPNMAQSIRNRSEFASQSAIGAVLLLPYFVYENKSNGKMLVSPDTHHEKAAEALKYYGGDNQLTIRQLNQPMRGQAVLDSLYLAGWQTRTPINSNYSEGGEGQDNEPHIVELYAAMGAKHFFDMAEGDPTINSTDPATFAFSLGNTAEGFNWNRIDQDAEMPMLKFMRFTISVLTFLHPLLHQDHNLNTDTDLRAMFGGDGLFGGGKARIDEKKLKSDVESVASFCKRFLSYMYQVENVGPNIDLYDVAFLRSVKEKLCDFAGVSTDVKLRDVTLPAQYTLNDRRKIYTECKLEKIRINNGIAASDNAYATAMLDSVKDSMDRIKKERVNEAGYETHSHNGFVEMCRIIYNYGAKMRF